MQPDQASWGPDPLRRNRPAARLLIAIARHPKAQDPWPLRPLLKKLQLALGTALTVDLRTGAIGEDLHLPHPFAIVVHGRSTIGDRVTIYQGVTIGEDNARPGVPVIGDDVLIGAGAVVLGPVRIGSGATVAANAVVLQDVPPSALAVGVPARILDGDRSIARR